MTLGARLRESRIVMFVAILGVLLTLPITLPLGIFSVQRRQRRLRKLVQEFPCVACRKILGADALRIADERWAEEVRKRQAASPYRAMMRMVRHLHAVCPHCGCEYTYLEKENALVRKAVDFEKGPAGSA